MSRFRPPALLLAPHKRQRKTRLDERSKTKHVPEYYVTILRAGIRASARQNVAKRAEGQSKSVMLQDCFRLIGVFDRHQARPNRQNEQSGCVHHLVGSDRGDRLTLESPLSESRTNAATHANLERV